MPKFFNIKPTWFPNGIRTQFLELGTTNARWDTTGGVNQSTNINNAITQAASSGSRIVRLPPGTLLITNPINLASNVELRGAGIGRTTLVTPTAPTNDPVNGGMISFRGVTNGLIGDLTLDMRATTTVAVYGIVLSPATSSATLANQLAFSGQTVNYAVGETVIGATSGATGVILTQADAGATGTLTLHSVAGTFIAGELLSGGFGGSATVASAMANAACTRCRVEGVQILMRSLLNTTVGISARMTDNTKISECDINGNSILETAAHEFYYIGGTPPDQEGIQVRGGVNIDIRRNRLRNLYNGIYPFVDSRLPSWDNHNLTIADNTVDKCFNSIKLESGNSAGQGVQANHNVIIKHNKIKDPWGLGIVLIIDDQVATTVAKTIIMEGVVIDGNTIDCRGSLRDANHAVQPILLSWGDSAYSGAGTLAFPGCKVVNNSFLGGGGGAAQPGNQFVNANGWDIINNTFDDVRLSTATITAIEFQHCVGLRFLNNIVSNCDRSAFNCSSPCNQIQITGNRFLNYGLTVGQSCGYFTGGSGIVFTNNVFDSQAFSGSFLIGGDANATKGTVYGNVVISGSLGNGNLDNIVWSGNSITTGTSGTIDHNFGMIKPSAAAATFVLTCAQAQITSIVTIQIVAGTQVPIRGINANGTITFASTAAFDGTTQFRFLIMN